jgi:hypothetical protein
LAAVAAAILAPNAGCGDRPADTVRLAESSNGPRAWTSPSSSATAAPAAQPLRGLTPSRAGCDTVPVFDAGAGVGTVCVEELSKLGLTIVDLSDEWTPKIFQRDPATGDSSNYRKTYIRLASLAKADLGLYGITPSLTTLAERLADEKRQACQAAIDRAPLARLHEELLAADERTAAALPKKPEAKPATLAAQGQLVCDRFLSPGQVRGVPGRSTEVALDAFRRRHMIVARGGLDADSVGALALAGDELDFRALLRGLRERVADAAGLIEDGSASGVAAPVVDRQLDFSRFTPRGPTSKVAGGAPDYVGAATDAAARALGWTSAANARAFVAALGERGLSDARVAVKLPPTPAYHSPSMEIRVEIDRGDVFYDTPGRAAAARKGMDSIAMPSFVVYARDGGRERPLVRWATTIGGWQKERVEEGEVVLKYKGSDVGDRVWRHLVAAPAWMPPDSTPEDELLREDDEGNLELKRSLIEPGYGNAYGLVMLIHEEPTDNGTDTVWNDNGIRTHGSVSYRSIVRGQSHGCHRLYNHLALRLSGYLLAHRPHQRRGKMHAGYKRTLEWKGQSIEVDVPTRGYLYELLEPIPVRVLEGRIVGEAQEPSAGFIRLKRDPTTE